MFYIKILYATVIFRGRQWKIIRKTWMLYDLTFFLLEWKNIFIRGENNHIMCFFFLLISESEPHLLERKQYIDVSKFFLSNFKILSNFKYSITQTYNLRSDPWLNEYETIVNFLNLCTFYQLYIHSCIFSCFLKDTN